MGFYFKNMSWAVFCLLFICLFFYVSALPHDAIHEHDEDDHDDDEYMEMGDDEDEDEDDKELADSLRDVFKKVDTDENNKVTILELMRRLNDNFHKEMTEYTDEEWTDMVGEDVDKENAVLTWKQFSEHNFDNYDLDDEDVDEETRKEMKKYWRRWQGADVNNDTNLTYDEYKNFAHPHYAPHMRDIFIDETMEAYDYDGDTKVSLSEYLRMINQDDEPDPYAAEDDSQKHAVNAFNQMLDKDGDGSLDRGEVFDWIVYDVEVHSEAFDVMSDGDGDGDGVLTLEEVLEEQALFENNAFTNYGRDLKLHHDEL